MPLHDYSPGAGISHLLYDFTAVIDQAAIDTNVDGPFAGPFSLAYSMLEIFAYLRTDEVIDLSTIVHILNNDLGANYLITFVRGVNVTASAGNTVAAPASNMMTAASAIGANSTAQDFGLTRIQIPNYAGGVGWPVAFLDVACTPTNAATSTTVIAAGVTYKSTTPVTRYSATAPSTKKLKAGSRVLVFGR